MNIARKIIYTYTDRRIQSEFYGEKGRMFGHDIVSAVYNDNYADVVFEDGSVLRCNENGWSNLKD